MTGYDGNGELEMADPYMDDTEDTASVAELSGDGELLGNSDYGRSRLRRRSRSQRDQHTSSGSESKSSGSTGWNGSKWSLKHYAMSGKEV